MNHLDLAKKILEDIQKPLSCEEIIKIAKSKGLLEQLKFPGDNPSQVMENKLLRSKNIDSEFVLVEDHPNRFNLTQLQPYSFGEPEDDIPDYSGCYEKHYYPLLAHFAYWKLEGCYIKRIPENSNKVGRWIHPDAAGVVFTAQKYDRNITRVADFLGHPMFTLFSFELKRHGVLYSGDMDVDRSIDSLRKGMGQAVANSSWANFGYLVAPNLPSAPRTKVNFQLWNWHREAKMLCEAHGIGLVSLNTADPNSSSILYPARKNPLQDLELMQKLAAWNNDFGKYLQYIVDDAFKTNSASRKSFEERVENRNFFSKIMEDEWLYDFYRKGCNSTKMWEQFSNGENYK